MILVPVLFLLGMLAQTAGLAQTAPDVFRLLQAGTFINLGLLIFNLLPIFPLDGGQILHSLLWFLLGRAWSLAVVTVLGIVGVVGLGLLALAEQSIWLGILAIFILSNCWNGLQGAARMMRGARAPRRKGTACPACQAAPPIGPFWICPKCRQPFDVFETGAACPRCGAAVATMRCGECGGENAIAVWSLPPESRPDSGPFSV